jgi:hypothetical protein
MPLGLKSVGTSHVSNFPLPSKSRAKRTLGLDGRERKEGAVFSSTTVALLLLQKHEVVSRMLVFTIKIRSPQKVPEFGEIMS